MPAIATLTMNPTLDKSASIDRVVPDEKLRCHSIRREPGGGGINVARAIKKLDGESTALYSSGGPPGQIIQNLLYDEGLDHRPIQIENWTREGLTVLEESTGQQFRFNLPGPTLHEAEWKRCLSELEALDPLPDYVVASGSLPGGVPHDFFARVAQMVKEANSRFVLDTSTNEALQIAAEEVGVYLIKPNLREFRKLVGRELEKEEEQEAAALDLVERGHSQVVVISLGAAGVLLATKDGTEHIRAPTVHIKSKVGAGDSTVAGIVLSLARGEPLRKAILFGVAAGAAAVMTPGTELCRLEDTQELYKNLLSKEGEE